MKFAAQNVTNASQIAKCEPLIRTLIVIFAWWKCVLGHLKNMCSNFEDFNLPNIYIKTTAINIHLLPGYCCILRVFCC